MKKILLLVAAISVFSFAALADDRPIDYNQLPSPAKEFIKGNFAALKITYVTKEDDFIRPDYSVMLADGTRLEFNHSGSLKQIANVNGISSDLIPVSIREYVDLHYPGAGYVEYEIGKRTYEVKLDNRLELKFSSSFHIIEVDD